MLKSIFCSLLVALVLQSCNEAAKSDKSLEIATKVIEAESQVIEEALVVDEDRANLKETKDTALEVEPVEAPETKNVEEPVPATTKETVPTTSAPVKSEEPNQIVQKPEIDEEVLKPDHNTWDALLKKYVSVSGQVNYKGFKADKSKLDLYLADLKSNPAQSDWSRNEKLAYWTNTYNAFTIDVIVRNYPVKSIMDLDKPWDKKFIEIDGKSYSLNQIEHEIVRPTFKDPRIHFAFVCAAKSCPKLLNAAYLPATIQAQFDRQTRHFINQSGKNQISAEVAKVSQLFNWYGDDFKTKGSVIDYLNQYATTKINAGAKLEFLDYDWALNE